MSNRTLKEEMLYTVGKMKEEGINIMETPPLFRWSYPELPTIQFELLITEIEEKIPEGETIQ